MVPSGREEVRGWKPHRDCRWIGYHKERSFPKGPRASRRCRPVFESKHPTRRKELLP